MAKPTHAQLSQMFDAAKLKLDTGDVNGAAQAFQDLAHLAPNVPSVALMQGVIAARLNLHETALEHLEHADRLQSGNVATLKALAGAYEATGAFDKAAAIFDQLIAKTPDTIQWSTEKALFLQRIGRFEAAGKLLRRLIKKKPDDGFLYRMITVTEKLKPNDPLLRPMIKAVKAPKTIPMHRAQFGFALSKVMSDLGKHDQVFPYLDIANSTERARRPFKYASLHKEIWDLINAQDVRDFPSREDSTDGFRPIFIVGTPRSGTTLIERVLAAHPQVGSIGESSFATRGISVLMGKAPHYTPLSQVTGDKVDGYRRAYMRHAQRQLGAACSTSVDKTMHVHSALGAIRYAMPAARLVVIHRDPRDVAVSMYRNLFVEDSHRYTNDLGDIARYIHDFNQAIEHWRGILPEAPYDLEYEAFVADPEAQTRALLEAVGLPWDDACLRPHESGAAVKTLSLHQVRQPIYKSSAKAWQRYGDALKPFDEVWEALNGAG
ncbi:tetratricopeptide repeat-containing sulfotransferase family protein [Pseudaestuariivita sp.]|uniref:tetratricopeptide repeat-containing sulfotransferase family protein n=1 Tax=Pseudaestuariivita sp. TaxID=2211669 RepID=UPI004057ED50